MSLSQFTIKHIFQENNI